MIILKIYVENQLHYLDEKLISDNIKILKNNKKYEKRITKIIKTVEAVFIVRLNKKENINIEKINKAMYFRQI